MDLLLPIVIGAVIVAVIVFGAVRSTFGHSAIDPESTGVTLQSVRRYGREAAVAGESYTNPDGTPRREIIAQLAVGNMVSLEREPNNPYDEEAVLVRSLKGVIGYVSRDDEGEIASWLDAGERVAAYITGISGGPSEGHNDYGVWLHVVSIERLKENEA